MLDSSQWYVIFLLFVAIKKHEWRLDVWMFKEFGLDERRYFE
jgi:hypothetical protein